MGLIDVLNGMANGPHGRPEPAQPGSGGMSKTTMALLALLAYKAYKNWGTSQQPQTAQVPSRQPSAQPSDSREDEGGLGGVLRTIFGGGAPSGNVLSRGVENTVRDFERSGHGDAARSWVGRGANREITPQQLEAALGEDAIQNLMDQTGMDRDELLEALSENLPAAINHLTPHGRLPTSDEAGSMA
jgi:uncharacterized protein YidB (DUF937 family)